jgi:hypothetical protein
VFRVIHPWSMYLHLYRADMLDEALTKYVASLVIVQERREVVSDSVRYSFDQRLRLYG